jgi:hypothetical protein
MVQVSKHLNNVKQIVKYNIKIFEINSTNCKVVGSKGLTSRIKSNQSKAVMTSLIPSSACCKSFYIGSLPWTLLLIGTIGNLMAVQNNNLVFFQNHMRVLWLSPFLIIPTSNYCAICTKLLPPCKLVGFLHSVHCFGTHQEVKIHPFNILFLSIHCKIVP